MAYELEKLPRDLVEGLERSSRGEDLEEYPAMPLEGVVGKWIMVVLGLLAGLLPCVYILDYRRMLPFDETMGCFLVSFLGMWILASGVGRLRRYKSASVKPLAVLGNHDLMVYEERGGLVEVTRLADIVGIVITNHAMARLNRKDLPPINLVPAGNLQVFCQELQRRRQAAMVAPLPPGEPGDWTGAAEAAKAAPRVDWSAPWRWGLHARVLGTGLLAAGVVIFAAWRHVAMVVAVDRFEAAQAKDTAQAWKSWLKLAMRSSEVLAPHEKFPVSVKGRWPYGRDHTHLVLGTTPFVENLETALAAYDDRCWDEARADGGPEALRGYLQDFPEPAHRAEAEGALRELYRSVEERYLAAAGALPAEAREGMRELLRSLAEDHVMHETVGVAFLPVEGIEGGAIEAAVKSSTGAKLVHPVGPSFSEAANVARHSKIVASLNKGLQRVVDGLFELEERPLDAPGPRILVGYQVKFSGNHFFSKSQASLPISQREIYVGIVVLFTCSIQTPGPGETASQDPTQGHPVRLLASPAPDFRVYGQGGSMVRRVYDRMAETAFDEFSEKIARTYGIGALSGMAAPRKDSP